MTTAEDPINTVATALRGAVDKAVDLIDSTHLHSLGDAGHEVASRVLAGTPDLTARLGSAPVDLHSLRVSTARRAHQLAQLRRQGHHHAHPQRQLARCRRDARDPFGLEPPRSPERRLERRHEQRPECSRSPGDPEQRQQRLAVLSRPQRGVIGPVPHPGLSRSLGRGRRRSALRARG